MSSELEIDSENQLTTDSKFNIIVKLPAKHHQDVLVENHEKVTLLKLKKQWDFSAILWDHETIYDTVVIQKIFQKNLCKVLEGFNCTYMMGESFNRLSKSLEFSSVLVVNLEILKKIFQGLNSDHITYLIKSSFFVCKEKVVVKDLFAEIEEMKGNIQSETIQASPTNKYFIDCNELINLMKYKVSNVEFGKFIGLPCQICFKLELFLFNNDEKISWKGKLLIIDHCSKPFSFDEIFETLKENGADSFYSEEISKEIANSSMNVFLKYDEVNSEAMAADFEKLKQIEKAIRNPQQQNPCNDTQEYITMILDLQKRACIKDYEIYNTNMNLFLKEKEIDECRLKIAQLESSLHYQEEKMQNISIVDPNWNLEEEQQPIIPAEEETEDEIGPERTQTIFNEDNLPKMFRSISQIVGHSLHQALWTKAFSSVNMLPDISKNDHANIIEFEENINEKAYEQLLEINYYEELTMLRTKFQKVNKELIKKSYENEKMMKLIEKLKEQHTVFNNLNQIEEEKKSSDDCLRDLLKKQEGEIKELKKMIWEKEKTKDYYHSDILRYYTGDVERIKDIISEKVQEIVLEIEKEKKEIIAIEIQKFLDIMSKQLFQKAKTNEELLKELNELYIYYYRKFHGSRK